MGYETILYTVKGAIATITLNRPQALNTIVPAMPEEIEHGLGQVDRDPNVKVVILRGAGRAFCAGFNFGKDFHEWTETHSTDGKWDPGKDFTHATTLSVSPTQKFMSIWRCSKPVIAQIHGWCVGGGSEYGLCADLVIASDDAPNRHAVFSGLGLSSQRHVDLPSWSRKSEGVRANRQSCLRQEGSRNRLDQPIGAVR
jgi:enoyl-CoA hydratase